MSADGLVGAGARAVGWVIEKESAGTDARLRKPAPGERWREGGGPDGKLGGTSDIAESGSDGRGLPTDVIFAFWATRLDFRLEPDASFGGGLAGRTGGTSELRYNCLDEERPLTARVSGELLSIGCLLWELEVRADIILSSSKPKEKIYFIGYIPPI
jgi:hypothetical protein